MNIDDSYPLQNPKDKDKEYDDGDEDKVGGNRNIMFTKPMKICVQCAAPNPWGVFPSSPPWR